MTPSFVVDDGQGPSSPLSPSELRVPTIDGNINEIRIPYLKKTTHVLDRSIELFALFDSAAP